MNSDVVTSLLLLCDVELVEKLRPFSRDIQAEDNIIVEDKKLF